MREKEVIVDPLDLREVCHLGGECRRLLDEGVLVQTLAGREVDDPRQRCQVFDGGVVPRLQPGEYIGGYPAVAEGAADLAHVYVEASVGVLAQRRGGRGVHGYDRDAPLCAAVREQCARFSHDMPISRRASASRRSKTRIERPANRNPRYLKTYALPSYSR